MIQERDYVALFHSIHRILAAEKLLKERAVDFLLIPAPRDLSSACGLAIRYAPEISAEIEGILSEADLQPAELFVREGTEFREI